MTTDVSSAKEGAQQPGRHTSPVGSGTLLGLADGRIVETQSDPARGTPESLDGIDDPTWAGRPVVSVSSDGGFGQYMSEFTTAVKYDMDVTHVLLNDDELGKISKEQRTGGWDVWQTDLENPEFAAFAENCGGYGVRVESDDELEAGLDSALDHDGPAIVEIRTDSDPV